MKHSLFAPILLLCAFSQSHICAQPVLTSQEIKNVNGTADTVVNASLPLAPPTFKLSGPITGTAAFFLSVTAQSTDGLSLFSGSVDLLTNNYLVKVPAGTYKLSVSYIASFTDISGISTYKDPASIQVIADTVHPIAVVPTVMHKVSGTVLPLDPRFPSPSLIFSSTDPTNSSFGLPPALGADGSYATTLADGTYAALLVLSNKDLTQFTGVNLGTVTVAGADVVSNFAAPPFSIVTGTVRRADTLPIPKSASVVGFDSNLFLNSAASATPLYSYGTGTVETGTGLYNLALATNHQYFLGVDFTLLAEDLPQSDGSFTYLVSNNFPLAGDTTQDILVPQPPGTVTVTGNVTDNNGAPLANTVVSAVTEQVTGIANAGFSRGTRTDSSGNYRLILLSGTNYDFLFSPPTASVPSGAVQTGNRLISSGEKAAQSIARKQALLRK